MTPPNRRAPAGRMFLDLCRLAQTTGHTTDELLQLYVLEGFLDRLQTVITFVDTLPT